MHHQKDFYLLQVNQQPNILLYKFNLFFPLISPHNSSPAFLSYTFFSYLTGQGL